MAKKETKEWKRTVGRRTGMGSGMERERWSKEIK